jgi:carboxyl-terminal processing protease
MKMYLNSLKLFAAATFLLFGLTASAGGPPEDKKSDFAQAEVMDRIILSVIEYYYDPARIDSLQMFKAIMDALQKAVAEIETTYDENAKKITVEILGNRISIETDDLNSPWSLSHHIHEVFGFIKEHVPQKEYDFSELEYLAANSMLTALDPHSNALPPDIYEALRMDTEGEFGGLGIRITTDRRPPCRGNLTVVEVFKDTPAWRAGLRPGDYITRIDGESTVNITTSEAADRLRGRPGSSIQIQIRRPNGATRVLDIRRATIPIESVTWKMLDGKVGYISLEAFQSNSDSEFEQALQKLHEMEMKGLILDLRDNPGGLLDVAIKIADKFLDSGTIVATAGRGGKDDESIRNATPAGTEPTYPLVVLIDSYSASAAEIIAGALRNHGRALLVGETTFGKGSVQMVQPIPGGGALKLTSAQYLIPGDISIQAVGVSPDVSFISHTIDPKDMDLGRNGMRFSEADLEHHLTRPNTRTRSDIAGAVKANLFVPSSEFKADQARFERCFAEDENRRPFKAKYEEEFARRLIAESQGGSAEELLVQAREMIAQDSRTQDQLMQKALKKLKVDWSPGPKIEKNGETDDGTDVTVKATAKIVGAVQPGREFKISVTVKNGSLRPIHRLYAVTKSDNPLLNGWVRAGGIPGQPLLSCPSTPKRGLIR